MSVLETIRSEADGAVYFRDVLADVSDALVLFAAGFLGRQDAFWIADAGVRADCVDLDEDRLHTMRTIYPRDWLFAAGDVYAIAKRRLLLRGDRAYDLVSADPPSGQFDRAAAHLPLFAALARRYVILGTGRHTVLEIPDGWELVDRRRRSRFAGGTYWALLEASK